MGMENRGIVRFSGEFGFLLAAIAKGQDRSKSEFDRFSGACGLLLFLIRTLPLLLRSSVVQLIGIRSFCDDASL